jgi:hypothetical protein
MNNIGIQQVILINGEEDRVKHIIMMMDHMNIIGIIIHNLIRQERKQHQVNKENMNIIGIVQLSHIK